MTSTTVETLQSETDRGPKFDYDGVKKQFLKRFLEMKTPIYRLLDRERMFKLVRNIRAAKDNLASGGNLSREQTRILKLFDVIETENGHRLIKAKQSEDSATREYIPCEDSFDIIAEAHLASAHGGRDKLIRQLCPKYMINKTMIELFLLVCNVCQHRRIQEELVRNAAPGEVQPLRNRRSGKLPNFNMKCIVFVIDMTYEPDGPFKYILVVRDSSTGFTQIRPVSSSESIEIAVELFKVFTDFGPPTKLLVNNVTFFLEVHEIMSAIYADFSPIDVLRVRVSLQGWANQIQYYLNEWFRVSQTRNWAIGCYITQWSLNNTIEHKQTQTPFHSVFGSTYKDPLQCLPQDFNPNEVVELSDESSNSDSAYTDSMDVETNDRKNNDPVEKKTSINAGECVATISQGVPNDTSLLQESLDEAVRDINKPIKDDTDISIEENGISIEDNFDFINVETKVEDVEKTLQDDSAKISVVAVEIIDNEMDIDDDVKQIVLCSYCDKEMEELNNCQQCHKPVHMSCCVKLTINNELSNACLTCLSQIKTKI